MRNGKITQNQLSKISFEIVLRQNVFVSYNDMFKNMNTKHILKVNDIEKLQVLRIIELQLYTQI